MRAIRARDTAIEKRVAGLLDKIGEHWHAQDGTLPGKPDFVIPEYRGIIFTHGCFWHSHGCYLCKTPATRTAFWLAKIAANVRRDDAVVRQLRENGWRVLIIWECALRGKLRRDDPWLIDRIEEWLCAGEGLAQIDTAGIHASPDPG